MHSLTALDPGEQQQQHIGLVRLLGVINSSSRSSSVHYNAAGKQAPGLGNLTTVNARQGEHNESTLNLHFMFFTYLIRSNRGILFRCWPKTPSSQALFSCVCHSLGGLHVLYQHYMPLACHPFNLHGSHKALERDTWNTMITLVAGLLRRTKWRSGMAMQRAVMQRTVMCMWRWMGVLQRMCARSFHVLLPSTGCSGTASSAGGPGSQCTWWQCTWCQWADVIVCMQTYMHVHVHV